MTPAAPMMRSTLCHRAALTEYLSGVLVAGPPQGIHSINARTSDLSGSREQPVQVRGADGLDQVPLDPRLAREFAAGMLIVSRQGNQSQVL